MLKEIGAAAAGDRSDAVTQEASSGAAMHPLISERVSNTGVQHDRGEAPPPPAAPTAEQQKQMLEFLTGLEKMKDSNPAEFDKAMSSLLGIPEGSGAVTEAQKASSLTEMISNIKGMRDGGSGGMDTDSNINIGGKKAEQKGIYITPLPGFVIKTRNMTAESGANAAKVPRRSALDDDEDEKGQKVFINICVHEEIGAPGVKKRLDENGEEVEGMNIPMSVGAGRTGSDKSGSACLVYDIIVNQKVLDEAADDKSGKYRDFVCQLGMQCLEQKYSLQLDRRYKLPKLKYQYPNKDGEVDKQYIKDRKSSPQIEEVEADSAAASKAAQNRLKVKQEQAKAMAEAAKLAEVKLPYRFVWVQGEGWEEEGVDGPEAGLPSLSEAITRQGNEYSEPVLRLPEGEYAQYRLAFRAEVGGAQCLQAADVVVKASPYRLTVKVPRYKLVSVYVPFSIEAGRVQCHLRRRPGFTGLIDLMVVLPLDPSDWSSAADPGSKQWLMEAALKADEVQGEPSASASPYTDLDEAGDGKHVKKNNGEDDVEKSAADIYHLKARAASGGGQRKGEDMGILHQEEEEIELPEDRFHRADASSSYYISQREQAVKDKWDKADKEREERKNNPDPNVEYIDMDDFQPGGKMAATEGGVESEKGSGEGQPGTAVLDKAAGVVADKASASLEGLSLSNSMWTELLD